MGTSVSIACIMHNTVIPSRLSGRHFTLYCRFLVLSVFLWSGFIIFMSPFLFNRLTTVRESCLHRLLWRWLFATSSLPKVLWKEISKRVRIVWESIRQQLKSGFLLVLIYNKKKNVCLLQIEFLKSNVSVYEKFCFFTWFFSFTNLHPPILLSLSVHLSHLSCSQYDSC